MFVELKGKNESFATMMKHEKSYNSYLWNRSEPFFSYLKYRSEVKRSRSFTDISNDLSFPLLGRQELVALYDLAYRKEMSFWKAQVSLYSPHTSTPAEKKLNLYLKSLLKIEEGKTINSEGIQLLPCPPKTFKKILIGPYLPDIVVLGIKPKRGMKSYLNSKLFIPKGLVFESNGQVHNNPNKIEKDIEMEMALESLGLCVVQVWNHMTFSLNHSFVKTFINDLQSNPNLHIGEQITQDLQEKIFCRTAAVHLSLSEMDECLMKAFGRDYGVEKGFEMILSRYRKGGTCRKIYDLFKASEKLGFRRRPSCMGSVS